MSDESNKEEDTIETQEGRVAAHHASIAETCREVTRVVEGAELRWLQSLADDGPSFVARYFPSVTDPGLKDYDAAFHAWQLDEWPQHTHDEVVQIVGGYLGNRMVADLGMEWVTLTDKYGTDYAVQSPAFEVEAFPFSSVLKRIERNEHDFVYGVYHAIKDTLDKGKGRRRE